MSGSGANLGVCFYSDRLFYSINDPELPHNLKHIGALHFNFNVVEALSHNREEQVNNIKLAFDALHSEHDIKSTRVLTDCSNECWTTLPKVVYDNADEREDHINILMQGIEREHIEPTWHTISNNDFKLLSLRKRNVMTGYEILTDQIAVTEFVSDFELGEKWEALEKKGGSFMMIGCQPSLITISSFVLGKLRAATFLQFDEVEDIPYLWMQKSAHLTWMNGLHEHIYIYGYQGYDIVEAMQGFWDKASEIQRIYALDHIGVKAEEETYGFDLACAFPAILLSLDI